MEFGDDDEYEQQRARWKTDMEVHSSWQLSPVSVLELHSDEESLVHHALLGALEAINQRELTSI
uniref:Uncharacterized protein n=1 Tax=Aegilops tauschii TaxID=37682 RepID=M8AU36_AEGTA